MIELKSVSGVYAKGSVNDVSFRLPNGKTYGIWAPHYADAVCLCALMSGARTPTQGKIFAGGFDLHREAKKARLGIGFLPADLLPDEEMTPLEYLMAVADMRELPFDKTLRHVHELLELADLAAKKEQLIANLSRGEKRILCILQLLLGKPEILILTSPLAGVTPKDAQRIRELIQYLGDTYTIFLSTPSAHDLCELCQEILILQDGALKTVTSADAKEWQAEMANAQPDAPAEELAPQKRKSTRWSMLTQTGEDYEVLDTNEKEDKK